MINISDLDLKFEVIDTIRLKCLIKGEQKTMNIFNVLYIFNAKVNLLSCSQILDKDEAEIQVFKHDAIITLKNLKLTA